MRRNVSVLSEQSPVVCCRSSLVQWPARQLLEPRSWRRPWLEPKAFSWPPIHLWEQAF